MFFRRKVSRGRGSEGAHRNAVGALIPAHASMGAVILRFQGRYECGCVPEGWEHKLVDDFCPLHGLPKVFEFENIGVQTTHDVMAPREIFD